MCGDGAKFNSDQSMQSIDYKDYNLPKKYDCQTLTCWLREKGWLN